MKKGILVVGKTGTGKSSFINAYLGNEKQPTSDSAFGCTTEIAVIPHLEDVVLLDTPGTGDVCPDGSTRLTNEQISQMIVRTLKKESIQVYAIVLMITINPSENRVDSNVLHLVNMLKARFYNYSSCIIYGIKDVDSIFSSAYLLKIYERNKESLITMGLSLNNYIVCMEKNFDVLIDTVKRKVAVAKPLELVTTLKRCITCSYVDDPDMCDIPCKIHGREGTPKHSSDIIPKHLQWVYFHTKDYSCGSWNCCGQKGRGERGCKGHYQCCKNDEVNVPGCQIYCNSCKRNVKQQGCIGTCINCGKLLSVEGCIPYPQHIWK